MGRQNARTHTLVECSWAMLQSSAHEKARRRDADERKRNEKHPSENKPGRCAVLAEYRLSRFRDSGAAIHSQAGSIGAACRAHPWSAGSVVPCIDLSNQKSA